MNKCFIIGRIANNLELRSTNTGKNICEFRLATNRPISKDGEKVTDFINCRVWNKLAENLAKYQTKGSLIAIVGRTQVDSYQDKEGNTKYINYILVEELEYLERKKDNNKQEENEQEENEQEVKTDHYEEMGKQVSIDQFEITDEDLPF